VIGAVLGTRQRAALRAGADPTRAFVDGYHTGLLVTILLMAAGVLVSYLTLRPRAAAAQAGPAPVAQIAGAQIAGAQTRAAEVAVAGESLGEI
jgi:hypothetical protein